MLLFSPFPFYISLLPSSSFPIKFAYPRKEQLFLPKVMHVSELQKVQGLLSSFTAERKLL